jgi:hypothetical protein
VLVIIKFNPPLSPGLITESVTLTDEIVTSGVAKTRVKQDNIIRIKINFFIILKLDNDYLKRFIKRKM